MEKNKFIKTLIEDIGVDIVAGILMAVSVQVFAAPAGFATAGVNGIALITYHLFGWKMGIVVMIINIPLVVLCYKFLGRRFLLNSIKSLIITSVLLDLIAPPLIPVYEGSPLLAAIFNGMLGGAAFAMIFMRSSSTGGTDFVIMTINKLRPHFSVGLATQIVDGIIILAGAYFFKNIDAVLYGIISVLMTGLVMDRIMVGANIGKVAFVMTKSPYQIAETINEELDRGSTFIKSEGSFTRIERNMVMCACATRELYKIKRIVREIDPEAFLVITDSREVYGEGFNPMDE